ncbi:MAG: GSCFA domain-containing protein [Chitinophagales bacterium]
MIASNFRTRIRPQVSPKKISYHTPILFVGSCFTENIGSVVQDLKFQTLINPHGILYNPFSIDETLQSFLLQKKFDINDLHFFNEKYVSFRHHGRFSNADSEKCLEAINESQKKAIDFLEKAEFLILTYGTAYVYEWRENGEVVANCHKIPARNFRRFRLKVSDITQKIGATIEALQERFPKLKIIFTLSPVRHWKDGAAENQVSKAVLRLSIEELCGRFANTFYFPAYEIMMDDLRDYRFYESDMIHPNKTAIDYIWQHFKASFLEEKDEKLMQEIKKIMQAATHRPLQPKSEAHLKFKQKQLAKIAVLEKKYGFLDFEIQKTNFQTE